MAKQVQIRKENIPEGWSLEAADFINRVKNFNLILSCCKGSHRID
jgi:hypothetical protein